MDLDDQLPVLLPALREALKENTNCWRKDDEFLTIFLRVRGYDLDRAASSVRDFYRNIEWNHDLLKDIRPSQFEALYDINFAVILRGRGKTGSGIALGNVQSWDPAQYKIRPLEQSTTLQVFNMLPVKDIQLNGISFILDMNGLSLSHVMQLTPREIKRLLKCAQGGVPMRVIRIHFINYPPIFWGVFLVVQKFLKAKLRKRIVFHNCVDSLYEYFDKSVLPITLGGELEMEDALDQDALEKLLRENKYAKEFYTSRVEEAGI